MFLSAVQDSRSSRLSVSQGCIFSNSLSLWTRILAFLFVQVSCKVNTFILDSVIFQLSSYAYMFLKCSFLIHYLF